MSSFSSLIESMIEQQQPASSQSHSSPGFFITVIICVLSFSVIITLFAFWTIFYIRPIVETLANSIPSICLLFYLMHRSSMIKVTGMSPSWLIVLNVLKTSDFFESFQLAFPPIGLKFISKLLKCNYYKYQRFI